MDHLGCPVGSWARISGDLSKDRLTCLPIQPIWKVSANEATGPLGCKPSRRRTESARSASCLGPCPDPQYEHAVPHVRGGPFGGVLSVAQSSRRHPSSHELGQPRHCVYPLPVCRGNGGGRRI